jgi:hypothetical protein
LAAPIAVTVAIAGLEEVQETWLVIPATEPSLNVPFAVNCCEPPKLIVAVAGETAIDVRVAFVTISVAVPTWPLKIPETVTVPGETPVAKPILPELLLSVAIPEDEDVHITEEVRSWASPFAKVPVALNCACVLAGIETL